MVENNGQNMASVTVESDDDKMVDRQIKSQILDLRQMIDDDERRLYVDRVAEKPDYTRQHANRDWGVSVRQYLRGIKRLWSDQEDVPLPNVEHYWKEMRLHDGAEYVYPPDKGKYRFSLVKHSAEYTDRELKNAIGIGRHCDLPEPYEIEFHGLMSVLGTERIEHTWVIATDKTGPPPTHNHERVSVSSPLPKFILENAVEAADNFLQQAGLGFDVQADDYTADGEPGI